MSKVGFLNLLWNAHLKNGEAVAEPVFMGERTPLESTIKTPDGDLELRWQDSAPVASKDIRIAPRILAGES